MFLAFLPLPAVVVCQKNIELSLEGKFILVVPKKKVSRTFVEK